MIGKDRLDIKLTFLLKNMTNFNFLKLKIGNFPVNFVNC